MESDIMVEPLPMIGVCNLCLNEGVVKSMMISSRLGNFHGSYTEMLIKCFSIDMTTMELGDTKHLICDLCTKKLEECVLFREQVDSSLKTLEAMVHLNKSSSNLELVKDEDSKEFVDVFGEIPLADDGGDIPLADYGGDIPLADDGGDDDEDNMLLKELIKKEEPEEETRPKKKKKVVNKQKTSKISLRKKEDTDVMLEAGLFPFKVKKDRSFSCALCSESSTNLDYIKKHIDEHTRANIHVAFKKMMYSNSQRFYKISTKLRCKICTIDICNYEDLKNHIDSCTRIKICQNSWNNLPFKLEKDQLDCPICKKTFLNFVRLNTHMNIHYPNFICENCGKAFASKARLRGHMRTHEVGSFPCKYCSMVFDRVTKRENHVSKEHKSGIRYACKRCNITLSSFYARQKHLAEVHNEELKRYKCKMCPQSYITPGHLSSHVRRDHLNERNHDCEKCDLSFYTRNALKMHMIKHDGERIHTCHICQKSYQRKKTLREHLRIHNNDKRFVCPVCGRAFTQKCTLKGHLKVHDRKIDLDDRVAQPLHSI